MSKKSRRNRKKKRGPFAKERSRKRAMWYKVGGVAVVLIALSFAAGSQVEGTSHPTPRADLDHAKHLAPASRYQAYPRVAETYRMVAAAPTVVDGLYCYCNCAEHSGHYSLLDCFASDHAARCDVCLSEGTIAYRMSLDGADLDAIRDEIDSRFRS